MGNKGKDNDRPAGRCLFDVLCGHNAGNKGGVQMIKAKDTIHDQPGKVFDCSCGVEMSCDGETASLVFSQLAKDDDNMGPMVYASMRGTKLTISLCDRDDVAHCFVWDEGCDKWREEKNT